MIKLKYSEPQPARLDHFVTQQVPQLNRSFVKKLCEQQKVLHNGHAVTKSGATVRQDDTVEVNVNINELSQTQPINLPILYEDDDCIVIDKPAGILTHSKGQFNPEGTVATFIQPKLRELKGERAGIVHRLDRVTSGVIICAKHPAAMQWLQKQFSQRKTKKTYTAVVAGVPEPKEAIIDIPVERNPKKPKAFYASSTGKPALTHYRIVKEGALYSLLELKPETGRTHQLRVHMAYIKHPIFGDELYGAKPADRVYLHAHQLEITLPNRQRKVFTSPVPKSFARVIDDGTINQPTD